MDFAKVLAGEFSLKEEYAKNIIDLIDEGCTIPFIARYRKEQHGTCDDQVLREFDDRLSYLKNLQKRKSEVQKSIQEQEKWTDVLAVALDSAATLTEVEDIYRPFKQKKKTRASVAIAKGLQPFAQMMMDQALKSGDILSIASEFVNEEKGVMTAKEAVDGAKDIVAEMISDDFNLRKILREHLFFNATICSKLLENEKNKTYEMYKEYEEKLNKIVSHRILAINRGETEDCLKVWLNFEKEICIEKVAKFVIKDPSIFEKTLLEVALDSFDRLIFPSLERELRNQLTEEASEQAIKLFETNLKPLLLQPPLKGKVVMAVDPAYRTGCKIAVVDATGNVLDTGVVYPTPPQSKVEEATAVLLSMIKKHKVEVISIGNGTASKEAEIFVVELIKQSPTPVSYAVVNEAGASVYSASKLGATEFPEFDVSLRSAVSIARRLQDPLAELIKIDVKSIGVGQYQHDMPQNRLTQVLEGVVEECVNSVGVDLNTASQSLLTYVAGLNSGVAKNIVELRKEKPFSTRKQLMKVPKLGEKAFVQCAGFLRIPHGENVLDNTAVHPESYKAVEKLLSHFSYTQSDVAEGKILQLKMQVESEGQEKIANICGVGVPTLMDIVSELLKPGRDIRDSLPPPILRKDLMDIKDLKQGMEIVGTVRNVIDFGVFVDIGVHQDGLVHISQIAEGFVRHPSDVLKVGDIVTVRVMDVDVAKKKISLTMKTESKPSGMKEKISNSEQKNFDNFQRKQDRKPIPKAEPKKEDSLEEMLKKLKEKYSK